jgi:small ligand-binding sensory domain FIST
MRRAASAAARAAYLAPWTTARATTTRRALDLRGAGWTTTSAVGGDPRATSSSSAAAAAAAVDDDLDDVMRFGSGLSNNATLSTAIVEAVAEAKRALGARTVPTFVQLLVSADYDDVALAPRYVLECFSETSRGSKRGGGGGGGGGGKRDDETAAKPALFGGVVRGCFGGGGQVMDGPCVSIVAARLPGTEAMPFKTRDASLPPQITPKQWAAMMRDGGGGGDGDGDGDDAAEDVGDAVAALAMFDPEFVEIDDLTQRLHSAIPKSVVVGGAVTPGGALFLGEDVLYSCDEEEIEEEEEEEEADEADEAEARRTRKKTTKPLPAASDDDDDTAVLVGVLLRGPFGLDARSMHACRPVGPEMTLTRSIDGHVLELDGSPAGEVLPAILGKFSSRWFPYDRVRVVNFSPEGLSLPAFRLFLSARLSLAAFDTYRRAATPRDSASDAFERHPNVALYGQLPSDGGVPGGLPVMLGVGEPPETTTRGGAGAWTRAAASRRDDARRDEFKSPWGNVVVVDVSPRGRLAARGKGGDGDGSAKLRGRVVDDDDDDADVEAEEEKEEQEEGGATDAAKAAEREAREKAAKEEKDAKDAAAATAEAERAYQSGGDGYVFRSIQSANNETGSVYIGRHRLEEGAPVRLHVRDTAWGKQRACALMKSFGEGVAEQNVGTRFGAPVGARCVPAGVSLDHTIRHVTLFCPIASRDSLTRTNRDR